MLETGPESGSCWEQAFFVLPVAEKVHTGDACRLMMHAKGNKFFCTFTGSITRRKPLGSCCQFLEPEHLPMSVNHYVLQSPLHNGRTLAKLSDTCFLQMNDKALREFFMLSAQLIELAENLIVLDMTDIVTVTLELKEYVTARSCTQYVCVGKNLQKLFEACTRPVYEHWELCDESMCSSFFL